MATIYLYAEVLANIRQANFYASLKTHKNEHTNINIASDRKTITVSHDGETASIYLPTDIGGTAKVNIPVDRGKEMSIRLELADIMTMPPVQDALSSEGPWSAKDLGLNSQLRCRACHTQLLNNEVPMEFKDLPSDHWAEMMDFWHCHKPHNAKQDQVQHADEAAKAKGYGSSNRLEATPGVAFVDTASILLAEQSCRNIENSESKLHCSNCKALLGVLDASLEGWKIYKSSLSIKASVNAQWESFAPEIFIASQLISLIESSAARKFVVHSDEAMTGLLIWVFNPDIHYSTSRRPEPVVRALKIFYQLTDDPQQLLDEHQASLEELRLPGPSFESFKNVLIESTNLLPSSARQFSEWTIGLIDRYERDKSDGLNCFEGVASSAIERSEA